MMREKDIRPIELLDEYLRLSERDVAQFFPDPERFRRRPCPGCRADRPEFAFRKSGFDLVRCAECRTLYVNPVPPPEALDAFYRGSESQRYWAETFFPAVAEARRENIFRPRVAQIRAILSRFQAEARTVVDVGAGTGIFLEECSAAGLARHLKAVEPSRNLAEQCRAKGLDTFEGTAREAAADERWHGTADLVASFEVIEHVPDIAAFVSELAELARPGGLLVMTGLCGTGFDILTLGARSKAVSPPHHLNFLSRRGIEALLQHCRLELLEFSTPGRLDVDIVRNTLAGEVPSDLFAGAILESGPAVQEAFQAFLAQNGLSSHLWIVARRPS